jgi:hypothetical protein
VVVSTVDEYQNLRDFVTQRLLKIEILEIGGGSTSFRSQGENAYQVFVNDVVEGCIEITISLPK